MSSKTFAIGSLVITGMAASSGVTAQADNINTSGVLCQNYNAPEVTDIDYVTRGVQNVSSQARRVICSIPRSPLLVLPGGFPMPAAFIVSGTNALETTTSCTVTVYTDLGNLVATSPPLVGGGGSWKKVAIFQSGLVKDGDFASVLCTLPGDRNGTIHGVTSLQ